MEKNVKNKKDDVLSEMKKVKRYKRDEHKKIEKLSKSQFQKQIVYLEELEKLKVEEQAKYFDNIFDKIYSGKDIESLRKYSLRCIKLTCDPKNNKIHLPYGVLVQKKDNKLIIKLSNNRNLFLFLLLITLLFLAILGSSYSAVTYSIVKNLNKDIDGDGIADINLDLNNDRVAEVNIDTNGDNKPDVNIDYKGNRTPTFNIDTDNDGIPDFNLINQDIDGDGVCDLNCDLNDDGWPDINLDLDGDGIADMEIDTDNDRRPDLNFDMNGDGVCDLHCDTNNDNKCDKFCLSTEDLDKVNAINSGTSTNIGNKLQTLKTGELTLEYEDNNQVLITDVYPDDQPFFENYIPTKKFKITNKSGLYIMYNLRWVVNLNDYESDNFKYKVASNNSGFTTDWITTPKETSPMATKIIIPPYTTQEYAIDFKLQGVGGNQDYDQGKTFAAYIEMYLDNEY